MTIEPMSDEDRKFWEWKQKQLASLEPETDDEIDVIEFDRKSCLVVLCLNFCALIAIGAGIYWLLQ